MTFWLIVVAVNVALHVVALAMVRRPIARDLELTECDLGAFSNEHRAIVESIDEQATRHGFRWFGAATARTWLDKPAQPAAIWWNGDVGAWLTFESIGRKWNLELAADLADGSMLGVSKVPVAHLAPPPGAVPIADSRIRSFDGLIERLPVDLRSLPARRGWPAPGRHWEQAVRRRQLTLTHWTSTGRATPTADGRGVRVSFWPPTCSYCSVGSGYVSSTSHGPIAGAGSGWRRPPPLRWLRCQGRQRVTWSGLPAASVDAVAPLARRRTYRSHIDHGADWFRRRCRCSSLRPELLRLDKRGNNKNCR